MGRGAACLGDERAGALGLELHDQRGRHAAADHDAIAQGRLLRVTSEEVAQEPASQVPDVFNAVLDVDGSDVH